MLGLVIRATRLLNHDTWDWAWARQKESTGWYSGNEFFTLSLINIVQVFSSLGLKMSVILSLFRILTTYSKPGQSTSPAQVYGRVHK